MCHVLVPDVCSECNLSHVAPVSHKIGTLFPPCCTSLMSKLQAPDKEATVRFTVDISETLQRKLSMLAACDRAQEIGYCADVVGGWVKRRGLGIRIFFILCDRCTPRVAIAFAC